MNHITFWGGVSQCGAYVLWVRAQIDSEIAFGRFRGGRPVPVAAGHYAYVGSAMGQRGASALAGRLLRHATRTGNKPPHAIRAAMADAFAAYQLGPVGLGPPAGKRLHWHVDYLLDESRIEIEAVTVIRTVEDVEGTLARGLAAVPGVVPLLPGLGASDAPGETHLLRLPDDEMDWHDRIKAILTEGSEVSWGRLRLGS